jgi:hypothetical protein
MHVLGTDLLFVVGGRRRLTFPLPKAPLRPAVPHWRQTLHSLPPGTIYEKRSVSSVLSPRIWHHGDDLLLPFCRAKPRFAQRMRISALIFLEPCHTYNFSRCGLPSVLLCDVLPTWRLLIVWSGLARRLPYVRRRSLF